MKGRKVQLFLKTPLFPFPFEVAGKRETFPGDIVVLEGIVKGENAGWWIEVTAMGRGDGRPPVEPRGLSEVVVPSGKVDFVRILS